MSHLKSMARLEEALRDLDASRAADPPLLRRAASLSHLRARVGLLNELGQVHAAEQAQAEVMAQMQAAGRGTSVQMAHDLHQRCILQWRMGRPREALASCEQARALAARLGNTGFLPIVDVFRARIDMDLARNQEALALLESALVRGGRVVLPFPRGADFVARLHQLRGNASEAVAALEHDLQQHGSVLRSPRDTINRFELAFQHLERGDAAGALDALAPLNEGAAERTFRWERDWLRARAQHMAGRPVEAEAAARAAIAEAVRRGPPDQRSTLQGHGHLELARALAAQGRTDEARAAAKRAADELGDALGPDHAGTRAALRLANP